MPSTQQGLETHSSENENLADCADCSVLVLNILHCQLDISLFGYGLRLPQLYVAPACWFAEMHACSVASKGGSAEHIRAVSTPVACSEVCWQYSGCKHFAALHVYCASIAVPGARFWSTGSISSHQAEQVNRHTFLCSGSPPWKSTVARLTCR